METIGRFYLDTENGKTEEKETKFYQAGIS